MNRTPEPKVVERVIDKLRRRFPVVAWEVGKGCYVGSDGSKVVRVGQDWLRYFEGESEPEQVSL